MTRPVIQQLAQSGATDRDVILWDSTLGYWVPGRAQAEAAFSATGILSVGSGSFRLPFTRSATIDAIVAAVSTAPTGASILIDVNKNGTTIFTNQANRPSIAASAFQSSIVTNHDVTSIAAGDYLTIDVDQIGSTIPGSNLTVVVSYH
jgi:hypothetical protein